MDILAPIVRWLIAPAWAIRDRNPYLRHYRRLLQTQFDPPAVIQHRQWERIQQLLQHAYETTRFWRRRLEAASLKPGDIRSLDDFRRIPLLTKSDLRAHQDELLSSKYDRASLQCSRTSGSTGVRVEVFKDKACCHFGGGCTLRSDEWSGWRLGERVAMIWGNPEYLKHGWRGRVRNALLERATYLDTLRIDRGMMARFAAALRQRPPSLIFGHAHSLYLFAKYLETCGGTDIRPRAIISSAMVLHNWERKVLENVFQCPVTDRYGCEEVGLIACECEEHRGLHVNADALYVEVLRPDGTPTRPGETGILVVTDLHNQAMPLIRYQIGDMAQRSGRDCRCGRTLPLLEKVEGRVADYVVTPRGELISGISLTENFAVLVPGIAQLQIVQEALDHFVFRIVRGPDFGSTSLEKIRGLVAERFGPDARYECDFVDRIPQEPSGKYRFCISKVEKSFCGTGNGAS
jgi:phenylacetate-CoA ligase